MLLIYRLAFLLFSPTPNSSREDYSFRVDLEYLGDGGNASWHQVANLESQKVSSWRELTEHEITFSCQNFDRPGFYQVEYMEKTNKCLTMLQHIVQPFR